MKVTKHTEKQLDNKLKAEIKTVHKDLKALDASFQSQLHKKCKPIDDKVMIILGTIDDLETQVEEIRESVNNIDFSKMHFNEEGHEVVLPKIKKINKDKATDEQKQSRVNVLSMVLDSEIGNLKAEYNSKFEEFESKLKKQSGMYQRSSYGDFLDLKDSNMLFEEVNHEKRIEEAQAQIGKPKDAKKRLVQNDIVLYQLYARYKGMIKELDGYKDNVMKHLTFEEKQTKVFIQDYKERRRSNSVNFKVHKVKDDVLGQVRIDYFKKLDTEGDYNKWNSNINERIEELEKYCKDKIPKKFNETIRNRGILSQEVRVLESALGKLKHEIEDLKNNTTKKTSDNNSFNNYGNDMDGGMTPSLRQTLEEKFKTVKKNYEQEIDKYSSELKSHELQLVKLQKEIVNKVDKSYIDTLEASINTIIKQSKGKFLILKFNIIGSNSITSVMKELTDDILRIKDQLGKLKDIYIVEFNSEKYDSYMENVDKRMNK